MNMFRPLSLYTHCNKVTMRMRSLAMLALLAVVTTGVPQDSVNAQDNSPVPVTVVLASGYPAFSPPPGTPGVPLRAVVLLKDPSGGDSRIVLLNPAYADAHTLYEALSIARRSARSTQRSGGVAGIGLTPSVKQPPSPVAARLRGFLDELKSDEARYSTSYGARGTFVTIPDAQVFFTGS